MTSNFHFEFTTKNSSGTLEQSAIIIEKDISTFIHLNPQEIYNQGGYGDWETVNLDKNNNQIAEYLAFNTFSGIKDYSHQIIISDKNSIHTQLESIDLSYQPLTINGETKYIKHDIKSIPGIRGGVELVNMTNLKILNLSDNHIQDETGITTDDVKRYNLKNVNSISLEELYLHNTEEIKERVGVKKNNIINISYLFEGRQPIPPTLPTTLTGYYQLTTLKKLNISRNSIERIPEKIYQLVNLRELDLSHNQITNFPTFLDSGNNGCKKLERLNLSHNNIQSNEFSAHLETFLTHLEGTLSFDISHNRLDGNFPGYSTEMTTSTSGNTFVDLISDKCSDFNLSHNYFIGKVDCKIFDAFMLTNARNHIQYTVGGTETTLEYTEKVCNVIDDSLINKLIYKPFINYDNEEGIENKRFQNNKLNIPTTNLDTSKKFNIAPLFHFINFVISIVIIILLNKMN